MSTTRSVRRLSQLWITPVLKRLDGTQFGAVPKLATFLETSLDLGYNDSQEFARRILKRCKNCTVCMGPGMPFFQSNTACARAGNVKPRLNLHTCRIRCASTESSPSLSFQDVDRKWRRIWSQRALNDPPSLSSTKPKSYILSMFPYPSGSLHIGHLRVYTISDALARYKKMRGFDVLHPMGWDAFGLPAENAAIERGIDPTEWTEKNITAMKEQLIGMNGGFDWTKEIRTCAPSFYKHTQKIFLMLHKRGLAYQAEALVNYDPVDKTVLANEQVDANGRSWRSGAIVEQLKLKQWFFRITAFKEPLLEDLDVLAAQGRWPERVILQQRNWLGKSTGAKLRFLVKSEVGPVGYSNASAGTSREIEVFTTRPDTLFGVTYLALSVNHPLVQQAAVQSVELQSFLEESKSFPPDSKAGFRLPKVTAINPLVALPTNHEFLGDRAFALPIYAAPYVLDEYGTGAVMGVPGHDSRDLAFWRAQSAEYPVPLVVRPTSESQLTNLVQSADTLSEAYTGPGKLTQLCGPYAGLENDKAGKKIIADLKTHGDSARFVDNWRLRDWLVSRQRYWGTPIPIVHCTNCGAMPVPEDQLPVELPPLERPSEGQSGNPLQNIEWWVNTACPGCGGPARRDTDTMDTFVDSSWYFMRFPDAGNEVELVSKDVAKRMLPVDTYLGGVEHAILHLLYARFIYKFLASEGLIPQADREQAVPAEPFRQLISQGMVHGKTFSDPSTGRFLRPDELDRSDTTEPLIKATGATPAITWEKMSKSKYNGVDPLNCMNEYGTDTIRAHILFAAPVTEVLDWDEKKIVGIQRWFHRIRRLVGMARTTPASTMQDPVDVIHHHSILSDGDNEALFQALDDNGVDALLLIHHTITSVTNTFEHNLYGLNTGVSDLIKLTNGLLAIMPKAWSRSDEASPHVVTQRESTANALLVHYGLTVLLQMLAPIAPAFAEQCWEDLYEDKVKAAEPVPSIFDCTWPDSVLDTSLAASLAQRRKTMTCAVQINGKLRFTLEVPLPSPDDISDTTNRMARDEFLAKELLANDQGRYWLTEKNDWEKRRKMIVVQEGKLVNVVF